MRKKNGTGGDCEEEEGRTSEKRERQKFWGKKGLNADKWGKRMEMREKS